MNHYLPVELSKKLVDRGVVSEFDSFWVHVYSSSDDSPDEEWVLRSKNEKSARCESVPAIHVFDLMIPENAKKVCGEEKIWNPDRKCEILYHDMDTPLHLCYQKISWQYHTAKLLTLIQSNGDYETYIRETMI